MLQATSVTCCLKITCAVLCLYSVDLLASKTKNATIINNVYITSPVQNVCISDRESNCNVGDSSIDPSNNEASVSNDLILKSNYKDNNDGTITDIKTGLMWKRCSEGQNWSGNSCTGNASVIKWGDAMPNQKQKLWNTFAGHRDWRLPTHEELRSLVWCSNGIPQEEAWEYNCGGKGKDSVEFTSPSIETTAFPNTPAEGFWSASLDSKTSLAWAADFNFGDGNFVPRNSGLRVRLVRNTK